MIQRLSLSAVCALLVVGGCQSAGELPAATEATATQALAGLHVPVSADEIGVAREGSSHLKGYLGLEKLPDSAALLPPPPEEGSARAAADLEIHQATRAYRDTERWDQAVQDNELHFPEATGAFACTLGVDISYEGTPHLYTLMRRTLADAGLSTYRAKQLYQRTRPFALLDETSCAPAEEEMLRGDGSYPSGHTALGWAWGLILAELAPQQSDAILKRAYEFGQSRVVCGVHWQSDVDAGRVMGAATVARLHADPLFMAQAQLARQEIEAAQADGRVPEGCASAR